MEEVYRRVCQKILFPSFLEKVQSLELNIFNLLALLLWAVCRSRVHGVKGPERFGSLDA